MAKDDNGQRIALQLEPRVAFEALILKRLEQIPTGRQQEWLRGLLVQGFRYECQTLRVVQDDAEPRHAAPSQGQAAPRRPGSAFATWLASPAPQADTQAQPVPAPAGRNSGGEHGKPFAGLRKVIG